MSIPSVRTMPMKKRLSIPQAYQEKQNHPAASTEILSLEEYTYAVYCAYRRLRLPVNIFMHKQKIFLVITALLLVGGGVILYQYLRARGTNKPNIIVTPPLVQEKQQNISVLL